MLGDNLRAWFELFDGLVVYRPQKAGGHTSDGWINWTDIEKRFESQKLTFAGTTYDSTNEAQRNELLNSIITYAGIFVRFKLLERRRLLFSPASLDYRVTPFGRRVGNWGYGDKPGFRKRAFFFLLALSLHAYRFRKIIAIGVVGWGLLNAARFYSAAYTWLESLPFAAWSAAIVAALVAVWAFLKSKVSNEG